jgi:tetratricopeptide (TPR) repeat protein
MPWQDARLLGRTAWLSFALLVLTSPIRGAEPRQLGDRPPETTTALRLLESASPADKEKEDAAAKPGVPTRATGRPADSAAAPAELPKSDSAEALSPKAGGSETPEEPRPSQEHPAAGEKPVDAAPAADKPESLTPIPDPKYAPPAEIEATSLKGITPGVSTLEELEKAWGPPKEIQKQGNGTMRLYAVDPFPRVEVSCKDDKVASVIIRFDHSFPAATVAQQLELAKIQPVFVSNELGEILGQAYPERGVLLAFEPGDAAGKVSMKVTHIILEPISPEPFLLRAETNLDNRYEFCLHDLDQAVKLQPKHARAHWLRSRVLVSMGDYEKAAVAGAEAVRLEPSDPRYRATHAQALAQVGQTAEAVQEAQKALELSSQRPHVKARALCLLGDLSASGGRPDFTQALDYHTQAVQAADPLASNRHPAIRIAAKEVLLDAHLGAAHDIAWGTFREKEKAVGVWLNKAAAVADDLIKTDGGSEELRLRVCARALTVCVGLRGGLDPSPWVKDALRSGETLIAAASDASHKACLEWELGMALYDSVQAFQMRSEQDAALKNGELAADHLEKSGRTKDSRASDYLLGRLYFRLGAIHAIRASNHQAAVVWFEKALEHMGQAGPRDAYIDLGRHGETFVSMGVSYWEAGQREKAAALTEHGLTFVEEAVRQGKLDKSALAVPYSNLASMHRQLGQIEKAERFEAMANKFKASKVR